jgi:uncharacterized membrane protein
MQRLQRLIKRVTNMMAYIRRCFISGLLLWLPVWATLLVIRFLVDLLGSSITMLPHRYQPDVLIGLHIPGIGLLITLIIIFLTGMIAANFFGKGIVRIWDALIGRIPLVRTVYSSVKQVSETLFTPGGQSFRKVLLVEYPRKGLWTLAFQTGDATPNVLNALSSEEMVSFFVPTTPNPTSGFLMMAPRNEVIEMNMSVDQALKFVISLGVVQPESRVIKEKKV